MKRRKLLFATLVCCLIAMLSGFSACGENPGANSSSSSSSSGVTCEHELETIAGKAATCTADGFSESKVCTKCHEVVEEPTVIPALGHDLSYSSTKTEATCSSKGLDVYACSRCDHTEEKESEMKEHTVETIEGKAATCEESGLSDGKKCSVCQEILEKQQVIPALEHTPEKVDGTAATCTKDGLTDGKKCSVCQKILEEQQVIPALEHTPEKVDGTAATCTKDGLTDGKKCSVCQKILEEQQVIPATDHSYREVISVEATCTSYASVTYACEHDGCTATKTETDVEAGYAAHDMK